MPSPSIKSYAKAGFGLGLGLFASQAIFFIVGLLVFFLPGLSMVKSGSKDQRKTVSYYGGIALMIVGVVLMGGVGFGLLMDGLDF